MNINNLDTTPFTDALAGLITAYDNPNDGRAFALGALQGLVSFNLNEKQLGRFTDALNEMTQKVLDSKNPIPEDIKEAA